MPSQAATHLLETQDFFIREEEKNLNGHLRNSAPGTLTTKPHICDTGEEKIYWFFSPYFIDEETKIKFYDIFNSFRKIWKISK